MNSPSDSDWATADRAYQIHHSNCRTCSAAGSRPNTQTRCPDGQVLWDAYLNAGTPPHFQWLTCRSPQREPNQAHSPATKRL